MVLTCMALGRFQRITATFLGLVMAHLQQVQVAAALPPGMLEGFDPYADPKHDINNPMKYIATNSLTAVSFGVYIIAN